MSQTYHNRGFQNSGDRNNSNQRNNSRRRQRDFNDNRDNRNRSNSRRRDSGDSRSQGSRASSLNRGRNDNAPPANDYRDQPEQRSQSRGRNTRARSRSRSSNEILEALTTALSAIALQPQQRSRSRRRGRQQSLPRSRSSSGYRGSNRRSFMSYEFRNGTARAVDSDSRPLPHTLSTQVIVPGSSGRLEIKFNFPDYVEAYSRAITDPTAVSVARSELRNYLNNVVENIIGAFDYPHTGCVPCPPDATCATPVATSDGTQVLEGFVGGYTDESTLGVGGWPDSGT